jgi:DNA ligase-associated metallophosphoesterase
MSAAASIETETAAPMIALASETLLPDPSGALFWLAAGTAIVADLHLEKGSSYGPEGITLPPYDTAATLAALAAVLKERRPERVICLGDSFHDGDAAERIDQTDRAALAALVEAHRWFWVAGNHDPHPPELGGRVVDELTIGGLTFRHEAERLAAPGEVIRNRAIARGGARSWGAALSAMAPG